MLNIVKLPIRLSNRPKPISCLYKYKRCYSHYLHGYVNKPTNFFKLNLQLRPSRSLIPYEKYISSDAGHSIGNLGKIKKIFAICLFSTTLLLAWLAKQQKLSKLKNILEDCIRLPVDKDLYKANVSLYKYHNFVFPGHIVMSGVLQLLPSFEFRNDDVIVASFPKSGTTWVQEIVYMLTHQCEESGPSSEILETRFPYLEYPYPGIKKISATPGPRFIKTHLPFSLLPESFIASDAKLIYCTRNPRDTVVSYWYFLKLLTQVGFRGTFEDFSDLFMKDRVPYAPYFDHVKSFTEEKMDKNVLIVSYEDLKEHPAWVIREIAEFLQIPINDLELQKVITATSFETMSKNASVNYEHWRELGFSNLDGKFMRKGEVGDWKNYFSSNLTSSFKEWENSNSHKIDFKFRYDLKDP